MDVRVQVLQISTGRTGCGVNRLVRQTLAREGLLDARQPHSFRAGTRETNSRPPYGTAAHIEHGGDANDRVARGTLMHLRVRRRAHRHELHVSDDLVRGEVHREQILKEVWRTHGTPPARPYHVDL